MKNSYCNLLDYLLVNGPFGFLTVLKNFTGVTETRSHCVIHKFMCILESDETMYIRMVKTQGI